MYMEFQSTNIFICVLVSEILQITSEYLNSRSCVGLLFTTHQWIMFTDIETIMNERSANLCCFSLTIMTTFSYSHS